MDLKKDTLVTLDTHSLTNFNGDPMNWISEIEYDFRYECEGGHESLYQMKASEHNPEEKAECLTCGKPAGYTSFLPIELNMVTKVSFDKNGIKAYRISDGKGGVTHISQTKYNYLQTGKIEHAHTDSHRKMLLEQEDRYQHLLRSDTGPGHGKVKKFTGFKSAKKSEASL